ncbi:MAG: hypothetical protein JXA81_15875 [Sedimentisphaerales bacterium]|nr:hypothetical protein [Sedimentisphaerales bacterium]
MLELRQNFVPFYFCIVIVLTAAICEAGQPKELEGVWDSDKYIGLDEIKPGMEAYCLTEYGVAGIEKFSMEVVDVVRNINPSSSPGSKDAILVKGIDERFIHTGPVAGCSGSPVYIDGRLAGALAFTWSYAKDPLYGATPIGEMLTIGRGGRADITEQQAGRADIGIDFTAPVDFVEIEKQLSTSAFKIVNRKSQILNHIPCPLITSGLSAEVCEQLGSIVEPFGLMIVAGGSSASTQHTALSGRNKLVPGAALAIPMVSGDISMSTSGTVTEVVGDKVYAFGHFLLGYGEVDLPMAAAKVHTVVSNMASSFKLTSVNEIIGAVTTDEATGVIGQLGRQAKTIALTIRVDRYNDTEKRRYNCRLVNNRLLTPFYLRIAIAGAAFLLGDLPSEHLVEYNVNISNKNAESISFRNVSSGMGLNEVVTECYSTIGLLMNNPYGIVDIESIDIDMNIEPKSIVSHIWSVNLSDSKVKAGQSVEVSAVLESVLAGRKQYQWDFEIPEDLADGKYELTICGQRDYEQFLIKSVPHRFVAQSLPGLIKALNNALQIDRDKLYCLLTLPSDGVTIETAELPDLPATRALLLQDAKRAIRVRPYSHWLERNLKTDSVVIDKKILQITVER